MMRWMLAEEEQRVSNLCVAFSEPFGTVVGRRAPVQHASA